MGYSPENTHEYPLENQWDWKMYLPNEIVDFSGDEFVP